MMKVSILDVSIYGLSTGIGPGLVQCKPRALNSGRTSGPTKTLSMSIKMSSSHVAPLEAPLPLIGLRHEVILLEMVRDLDETLAVSTKCHLLDLVLIDIPSAGPASSA